MDFFAITQKKLGLTKRETQEALKHLVKKYPLGEHAELQTEEIQFELELWLNERKWAKKLEPKNWL